jgi:single-strand DNA-binding protein
MANLNKVMLIGRLTRDPEPIQTRGQSGQGAKFGFAVNNRKFNQDTQTWEDVPVFIDMEIWNRGENSRQADRVLQTLRKGQQVFIEGHLKLDTWTEAPEKGGAKRSQLRVVVENFQYLERREDGGEGGMGGSAPARQPMRSAPANGAGNQGGSNRPAPANGYGGGEEGYSEGASGGGYSSRGASPNPEDDIPF